MFTEQELKNIKKKSIDPVIQKLCDEHLIFIKSPYANSYLSCLKQITYWNLELDDAPLSIASDNAEMAMKIVKEQSNLVLGLDKMRGLILPEDAKMVQKQSEDALGTSRRLLNERKKAKNGDNYPDGPK